jgi:uracil-DNA glycosylase family 4
VSGDTSSCPPAAPPGTGWPGDPASPSTPVAGDADGVGRLAATAPSLAELDARVSVCRACPRLVAWREEVAQVRRAAFAHQCYWGRPVPSFGDPHARIVVVGLAPAAHGGNRTGRMFTGDRSGDWLYAALYRAGLATQPTSVHAADGQQLAGVRLVAPVHCAPPANRPTPTERDACAQWLARELALLPDVRVFVALGGFAWNTLYGVLRAAGWPLPARRPAFGHGAEFAFAAPGRGGAPVVLLGCYHVSQQNTFTGRLTEPMLDAVFAGAVRIAFPESTPRAVEPGEAGTVMRHDEQQHEQHHS